MRRIGLISVALLAITTLHPVAAQAAPQTIQVDLGQRTGPVRHGANGALYAMSDDGVPGDNALAPLKIKEIAQKPPAGAQHPNGDTLMIADAFFRTGGQQIQVYIQDMYPTWPYDNLGIDDYLQKVETVTRQIVASPHRDRFIYVPFNEPDFIWYDLTPADPAQYPIERDRFFSHWARVFHLIRSIHPGARIIGPNETHYHAQFLSDFFAWTRDHGVLPDIASWHELSPSFFTTYRRNYAAFRELERQLGIGPLPISINEYANRRDLTVPGQMVQWVSRFEDTKVDADMPYWHVASNLAGQVVQTNKPNGGWWFLKMYADMTGETVAVTPPDPNGLDTLQGMASIDDAKRQAHVVVGGTAGDTDVVIRGIDPRRFGHTVRATVSTTTWSGYDADAPPPVVLADGDHRLRGDTLTVPLRGMDRMAAYQIVLTPGGTGSFADTSQPWQASYEAESARIADATVRTLGTPANANDYAASGTRDVWEIRQPTSSVTFPVTVPATGRYRLSILYGNQTGDISQQVLRIDGAAPRFIDYPATLNWGYRARKDIDLELTRGSHELTFATTDPTVGAARGEASLDRIDLRQLSVTVRADVYEAELSDTTGNVAYQYGRRDQSGPGYLTLPREAQTTFVVYAPEDGYYDLSLRYSAPGRSGTAAALTLGGTDVDGAGLPATGDDRWRSAPQRLFLSAGINRVGVRSISPQLALDAVTVRPATTGPRPVRAIEAEAAQLAGTAQVVANQHASGGAHVGFVGNGAANTLTLTGITAARGGQYLLAVRYANNERGAGHQYNANIISRAADISINGAPPTRVWFRNTWAWNNFWTLTVPVTLRPGSNKIQFANSLTFAPDLDRIDIAPLLVNG
jgi:hypothetical protein